MFLTYVIPFRAKGTTGNWPLVSELCLNTIKSCLNTGLSRISVLLVGHEPPDGIEEVNDDRLVFIRANWHPPDAQEFGRSGMDDKWRKVAKGFVHASRLNTDYIMIVDADDLVSRRLPEHLCKSRPENGLIIKNGYRYQHRHFLAEKLIGNFNCGSNAILNARKILLPASDDEARTRKCVGLSAGHTIIDKRMKELGMALEPVPFFAAVHVTHGEQHSLAVGMASRWAAFRRYPRNVFRLTIFAKKKRREFGIVS